MLSLSRCYSKSGRWNAPSQLFRGVAGKVGRLRATLPTSFFLSAQYETQVVIAKCNKVNKHGSVFGTVPNGTMKLGLAYCGIKLEFALRSAIQVAMSFDAFSTSFKDTNSTGVCM